MHDFINARQQLQTLAEKRKDFLEKIDSRIEYFKDQFLELLEKEYPILELDRGFYWIKKHFTQKNYTRHYYKYEFVFSQDKKGHEIIIVIYSNPDDGAIEGSFPVPFDFFEDVEDYRRRMEERKRFDADHFDTTNAIEMQKYVVLQTKEIPPVS